MDYIKFLLDNEVVLIALLILIVVAIIFNDKVLNIINAFKSKEDGKILNRIEDLTDKVDNIDIKIDKFATKKDIEKIIYNQKSLEELREEEKE